MSKPPSFADLFEAEAMPTASRRKLSIGDQVEGVVAHITKDEVFVELDAKQQGWFDRGDLTDPDGELRVAVGATVVGQVVAIDESADQVRLGSGLGKNAGIEDLMAAREREIPVSGTVTGVNKGGAEVDVGSLRGFCPFSQLDVRYVEDPTTFVGQRLEFLVVEVKSRDVVLSRRRLLERQAASTRDERLATLLEGADLQGRVSQVREFGAFVDIGGVEGLIPMRELSHDRVQRADDVLSVGDVVDVRVLKLEKEGDRTKITLSLKALASDPWDGIRTIAPIGQVVAGQVTRIADFGAFVRIASGVEGLLHVSELGQRTSHPSEALEIGQQLVLVVRDVDRSRRRISLALAASGELVGDAAKDHRPILNAVVTATVEKHERFGVFAQVAGTQGRNGRGLVPTAELGITRGADVRKELPIGSEIRAKVVDATEGRMRLSIRAAHDDAERAVYDNYRHEQSKKGGMGTLAELLKNTKLDDQ